MVKVRVSAILATWLFAMTMCFVAASPSVAADEPGCGFAPLPAGDRVAEHVDATVVTLLETRLAAVGHSDPYFASLVTDSAVPDDISISRYERAIAALTELLLFWNPNIQNHRQSLSLIQQEINMEGVVVGVSIPLMEIAEYAKAIGRPEVTGVALASLAQVNPTAADSFCNELHVGETLFPFPDLGGLEGSFASTTKVRDILTKLAPVRADPAPVPIDLRSAIRGRGSPPVVFKQEQLAASNSSDSGSSRPANSADSMDCHLTCHDQASSESVGTVIHDTLTNFIPDMMNNIGQTQPDGTVITTPWESEAKTAREASAKADEVYQEQYDACRKEKCGDDENDKKPLPQPKNPEKPQDKPTKVDIGPLSSNDDEEGSKDIADPNDPICQGDAAPARCQREDLTLDARCAVVKRSESGNGIVWVDRSKECAIRRMQQPETGVDCGPDQMQVGHSCVDPVAAACMETPDASICKNWPAIDPVTGCPKGTIPDAIEGRCRDATEVNCRSLGQHGCVDAKNAVVPNCGGPENTEGGHCTWGQDSPICPQGSTAAFCSGVRCHGFAEGDCTSSTQPAPAPNQPSARPSEPSVQPPIDETSGRVEIPLSPDAQRRPALSPEDQQVADILSSPACKSALTSTRGGSTQISVMVPDFGRLPEVVAKLASDFEGKTGVKVLIDTVPLSEITSKIVTAAANGSLDNDLFVVDQSSLGGLSKSGMFLRLDSATLTASNIQTESHDFPTVSQLNSQNEWPSSNGATSTLEVPIGAFPTTFASMAVRDGKIMGLPLLADSVGLLSDQCEISKVRREQAQRQDKLGSPTAPHTITDLGAEGFQSETPPTFARQVDEGQFELAFQASLGAEISLQEGSIRGVDKANQALRKQLGYFQRAVTPVQGSSAAGASAVGPSAALTTASWLSEGLALFHTDDTCRTMTSFFKTAQSAQTNISIGLDVVVRDGPNSKLALDFASFLTSDAAAPSLVKVNLFPLRQCAYSLPQYVPALSSAPQSNWPEIAKQLLPTMSAEARLMSKGSIFLPAIMPVPKDDIGSDGIWKRQTLKDLGFGNVDDPDAVPGKFAP